MDMPDFVLSPEELKAWDGYVDDALYAQGP